MKKSYLFSIIILSFFLYSGIVYSQIKYNDEIKKSSMSTEDAMDYYIEELRKDPYVKEHYGWKLFFAQHPMYLLVDEDRGEPAERLIFLPENKKYTLEIINT